MNAEPSAAVTRRPLTLTERLKVRSRSSRLLKETFEGAILFGLLPSLMVFLAVGLPGHLLAEGDWPLPVGAAAGFVVFSSVYVWVYRGIAPTARLVREQLSVGEAEVISVTADKVLREPTNGRVQYLLFPLETGCLLLNGQWLFDPHVYETSGEHVHEGQDLAYNGAEPGEPDYFPATRFQVARLPVTNDVLSVTVEGPYLEPTGKLHPRFLGPEVFEGDVSVIERSIEDFEAKAS